MSLDITALQIMKHREKHQRLARFVPKTALQQASNVILSDFGKYFKENAGVDVVEYEPFRLWFRLAHPTLKEEKQEMYAERLKPVLLEQCPEGLEQGILGRLAEAELAGRVLDHVTAFNNGDEIEFSLALRSEIERHEDLSYTKVSALWDETDVVEMLGDGTDPVGLRWRLAHLDEYMLPLRGGHSVIWAGQPGEGKTSGLMGEVTYMASQFDSVYGEHHGRSVVWLNNEGTGKAIKWRAYQAALNANDADMAALIKSGKLHSEYAKAVGDPDRIKVFNIHGAGTQDVEQILKRVRAGLIVADMLDNVQYRGATSNGGERTDQILEALYAWGRDLAIKYDCPLIASSQTSAAAEGMPYPPKTMLKDSKTGKAGACDAIVIMGSSSDAAFPNSRFIKINKTKMPRPGKQNDPGMEVIIDKDRSRLLMPSAAE